MKQYMTRLVLTIAFSSAFLARALAGSVEKPEGWWVVLASLANHDLSAVHDEEIKNLRVLAGRCGFQPFNDFSNKFRGFDPGFDVVALGAFKSRQAAESVRRRVSACVPGAYIKYGRHLGE